MKHSLTRNTQIGYYGVAGSNTDRKYKTNDRKMTLDDKGSTTIRFNEAEKTSTFNNHSFRVERDLMNTQTSRLSQAVSATMFPQPGYTFSLSRTQL